VNKTEAFLTSMAASAAVVLATNEGHAQTMGVTAPPPEQYTLSPGGVDMRSGRFAVRETDLAIGGTPDQAALKLERNEGVGIPGHVPPFASQAHNWDIMLVERRTHPINSGTSGLASAGFELYVSFGGRTETFEAATPALPLDQRSRSPAAKLSQAGTRGAGGEVYTYTAADGSVVEFRPLALIGAGDCSVTIRCAYAAQVIEPDGTRYALNYETRSEGNRARLKSVVSNRSHAVLFEHAGPNWNLVTKACVLNLGLIALPASGTCPAGANATNYGYTDFGGAPKLQSVTDPAANMWSFGYGPTNVPGGVHTMSFTRPGESQPYRTHVVGTTLNHFMELEEITVRQDFADGTGWIYNYDYSPQETGVPLGRPTQQLAGGTFENLQGERTTVKFDFPLVPDSMVSRNTAPSIGEIMAFRFDSPSALIVMRVSHVGYTHGENGGLGNSTEYDTSIYSDGSAGWASFMQNPDLQSLVQCNECSNTSPYLPREAFQITPGPIEVIDPLGRKTTFDYCNANAAFPIYEPNPCQVISQVQSSTDPEGRKTLYTYSATRLVKAETLPKPGSLNPDGTTMAALTVSATYPATPCTNALTCNKPLTTTDARNATTDYTYWPEHGALRSELLPAPAPGAARPLKRFDYALRHAWVKDAGGVMIQSATPVWVPTSVTVCQAVAGSDPPACDPGALQTVTTFEYGAAGTAEALLVKGEAVSSGGTSYRTCYGYDALGRRISQTDARGVCP
jgi:hypothetical protein